VTVDGRSTRSTMALTTRRSEAPSSASGSPPRCAACRSASPPTRSGACRRWRTRSPTSGFPGYFHVELALAKLVGIVLLLAPVSARLKEWAYAGFAFTLASALIAHFAVGDGAEAWGFAAGTSVLWASRTSSGAA
jgi:hypothetical protein